MAASLDNTAWLQWMTILMGGGSRQSYAATLPPNRFYCLLDELPLHLIPQRFLRSRPQFNSDRSLFLNPECIVCPAGQLPEELASQKEALSGFALQSTIAWVRNSTTGCLLPFWLGPQLEAVVRAIALNERAPVTLRGDLRDWLIGVGILTSEEQATQRRNEWASAIAKSALAFQKKGYAALADLIHPFHIAALRRYYRHLIRTGAIKLGDGQSPRRYVAYNEPVARFFHRHIASTLSAVAGQPLKPSYVYMASYLSGAELKKHTDRAQCEFSVTLCLDYSPEPALETPWPIRLDTAEGSVTVYQGLGDGLAYRGTRLPHYRDALAQGQTSTSIFFHYVPEGYEGSLN